MVSLHSWLLMEGRSRANVMLIPRINSQGHNPSQDRLATVGTWAFLCLGLMSLCYWWPIFADVSRLAFLCYFPAVFPFGCGIVHGVPRLDSRRRLRILRIMIAVHCSLLAALAIAWRMRPDIFSISKELPVFGFLVVDFVAMYVIVRLNLTKANRWPGKREQPNTQV
jgi:hypothetical protein